MAENISQSQAGGKWIRNISIAVAAIGLSVLVFLGTQTENASTSLESQAKHSTPLEVALGNGKPTLTEFYANWCTSCQAMAKDLANLKKQYADSVNFVMLNVDNSKWLPEIMRYRVDGIPHFVFLNAKGEAKGETIGKQPHLMLEANIDALIADRTLPYIYSTGQVSQFQPPEVKSSATQDDPRSHGGI